MILVTQKGAPTDDDFFLEKTCHELFIILFVSTIPINYCNSKYRYLGGGFKHFFIFTPILGETIQLD